MNRFWVAAITTASTLGALGSGAALACSLVEPPMVFGLLGQTFETSALASEAGGAVVVPRNVAARAPITDGSGTGIPTEPVPGSPFPDLRRPTTLLGPGTLVLAPNVDCCGPVAEVGDHVDTTAPERPTIVDGRVDRSGPGRERVGCDVVDNSCGTITTIEVDVAITDDDHTPADRITYALFLANRPEDAETVEAPSGFFLGGVTDRSMVRQIWRYGDRRDAERDVWATVVALDEAGNASPRSEAFPINRRPDGCRAATAPRAAVVDMVFLGVAGGLLAARARRRARG